MAVAAPIIGLALSAYGAYSSYQAAGEAEDLAKQNAAAEARATEKAAQDMAEENARREAMARARASASGVGGTTMNTYISELESAGRKEIDWLKEIGASRYSSTIQEGDMAYNEAMSSVWGNVGQGASSVADLGVQQEWWK